MQTNTKEVSQASNKRTINWIKIREDFCCGMGNRELSRKYGVSSSAITKRSHKEGWKQLREHVSDASEQAMIDKLSSEMAEFNKNYIGAITLMAEKVIRGMEKTKCTDAKTLYEYMAILKNLKDVGAYRSKLDIEEQEARIAKLQKECEKEEKDVTFTVEFDEELKKYID